MSWQTYIIHPYVTSGVLAAIVGIALVWCGRQNIGRLFTRTAFFWLVNIVFMAISAYHAAPFFGSVVSTIPGLEWAAAYIGLPVALVIDGVTIVFMQARMEASYKRDYKKQGMYTRYVFAAAGLNTIANLYTDIQHFQASHYDNIPSIMVTFAPVVLSVFPMFLVAISKAADEMVNIKPLEKLNVSEFEAQEKKRVEILEVQAFYLERETVAMQRLIAVERLQKENELLRRAIPTKSFSWPWQKAVDIDAIVAGVTAKIKAVYEPQIEALKQRLEEVESQPILIQASTQEVHPVSTPLDGLSVTFDDTIEDTSGTPEQLPEWSVPAPKTEDKKSTPSVHQSVNNNGDTAKQIRKILKKKPDTGPTELAERIGCTKSYASRIKADWRKEQVVHSTPAKNGHSRNTQPLGELVDLEV